MLLLAAPLDDYWHRLYGLDVTLWAPFHIMGLTGGWVGAVGSLMLLASERHRTQARGDVGGPTVLDYAIGGMLFAIPYMTTIIQAYSRSDGAFALIAGQPLLFAPMMVALGCALSLELPAALYPFRWMATATAGVMVAIRAALIAAVPWLIESTRVAEGLVYRTETRRQVMIAYAFPVSLLLGGLILDGAYRKVRETHGPEARPPLYISAAAALAVGLPVCYQDWRWFSELAGVAGPIPAIPMSLILGVVLAPVVAFGLRQLADRLQYLRT